MVDSGSGGQIALARTQVNQEYAQIGAYNAVMGFWTNYQSTLAQFEQLARQATADLGGGSSGSSAALTAFQQVMSQGQVSLQSQIAAVANVPQQWQDLIGKLTAAYQAALAVPDTPAGNASPAANDLVAKWTELKAAYQTVAAAMNAIPNPQWRGPGTPTASAGGKPAGGGAAGKKAGGGAAAGGAAAGGGTGSADSATAGDDSATSGDDSAMGGDDSAMGGDGSTPST
ncbi:MAG TPA: hypothetical protein VHZ97_22180, partial [Pseudonocardiaceae bacterium]|nr:hypothetical protein [Pseudonocardiaceae bacterium]